MPEGWKADLTYMTGYMPIGHKPIVYPPTNGHLSKF